MTIAWHIFAFAWGQMPFSFETCCFNLLNAARALPASTWPCCLLTTAFCDGGCPGRVVCLVISLLRCQRTLLGLTRFPPTCSWSRTLAWTPRYRKPKPLAVQLEESEVRFVVSSIQSHCLQHAPNNGQRELWAMVFIFHEVTTDFRFQHLDAERWTLNHWFW